MRKVLLNITLFLICFMSYSQVGIGTTVPQATLDIVATNQGTPASTDGVLIPRIDAFPATSPGAAQQGMLVYLTTTDGTNVPGFYFWDNANTVWSPFFSNAISDFYREGTNFAAANTTDDIYRMGNIAIGKNTADAYLDIEHSLAGGNGLLITTTGTGIGTKYNIYNDITSNASGSQYAIYNNFNNTSTLSKYGIYNNFNNVGGARYGVFSNNTGSSSGIFYGVRNNISNSSTSTKYGLYNLISSSNGRIYGLYNNIIPTSTSSSDIYGLWTRISAGGTATHYGVYSNVLKSGSYAGYFLGDVYLGTTTTNGYKLPSSDGTANQVLTTDGSGQTSWQDASGSSSSLGLVPIGSIIAWHASMTGVPTLPSGWQLCNGTIISDPDSPMNGQNTPNLNNSVPTSSGIYSSGGRYLRGASSSGTMQIDQANNLRYILASGNKSTVTNIELPLNGNQVSISTDDAINSTSALSPGDSYAFRMRRVENRPVSMTVVWIMRIK